MRLLFSCQDQVGIVAKVTAFLAARDLNILTLDQHTNETGYFFMRLVIDGKRTAKLEKEIDKYLALPLQAQWQLTDSSRQRQVVIFCSRQDHCLSDLIYRTQSNEMSCQIKRVISNHQKTKRLVENAGIPFHYLPINKETKPQVEQKQLELCRDADLVVLARYMQILSADFLEQVSAPVINIHHSFLPAFVGADPYRRAWERGVKLIGATSHFVTEELDMGPIIEQDITRVTHRHSVEDLVRLGAEVEKAVLARAVRDFVEDRVIVDQQKTVVFK
jgi:formyltetrahydrofolate deformylase